MVIDPRLSAVLEHVSGDETIELARDMIRIPSITGHEGRALPELMLAWLREAGLEAGLQEIAPDRVNVWARLEGNEPGPRFLLNGHLDTKPIDNMVGDPLSADVRDGKLWGRGACDMKSAVAAAMIATRALKRSGVPFRGTLLFGSEVGEEGGGWRLVDLVEGPCQCDAMLCCEPTELELHVGARGGFPITVTTKGLATHTGMAYRGINAIQKMAHVIGEMYAMPCFHRVDPLWGRSPINAQEIRGGGKVTSSVADECETIFDIRLNPDLPPDMLHIAVDALFERLRAEDPQLDVSWIIRSIAVAAQGVESRGRPATALPPEHPLVVGVLDAAESATGARPRLAGFPGGCSAGVLMNRGIPGVILGPGSLEQAHGAIEWIEIDQVHAAVRIYAAAALQMLTSG